MDFEKFERDLRTFYKESAETTAEAKTAALLEHISTSWQIKPEELTPHELRVLANTVLDAETSALHNEVEELIAQKERIERLLERKSDELQHAKYSVFDVLEQNIEKSAPNLRSALHPIKLQSIDLFDILEEMIESAIITTLEKGHDIEETIEEITKEVTIETIEEGQLVGLRVQKIISTILQSAINVAEATPNAAEEIMRASLRGTRSGLIRVISRFKQQLLYMPDETKATLASDFKTLENDLHNMDALFEQCVHTLAYQNSPTIQTLLPKLAKEIRFDMEELAHLSKETVELMRERLAILKKEAILRSNQVMNSKTAAEAKRMGIQAWSAAKSAIDGAIKSAKDAMDKRDK